MEITRTETDGAVTLKVVGCLDTAATPQFAAAIDATSGCTALALDFSEVDFVSSSALRTLVAMKKTRGAAFPVALLGLNEVVREVFDVTGLDEVFDIR